MYSMSSSKPCKHSHTPFTATAWYTHAHTRTHTLPRSKTHTSIKAHTHKTGYRHTHWGYSHNSVHCSILTAHRYKGSKMVQQRSHSNNATQLLWPLLLSANHHDLWGRIWAGENKNTNSEWRSQNDKNLKYKDHFMYNSGICKLCIIRLAVWYKAL